VLICKDGPTTDDSDAASWPTLLPDTSDHA
jgi:hypothetical protein